MGIFNKLFKPNVKRMEAVRDVQSLVKALENKDEDVRVAAVHALGNIKNHGALEPLIHALKDENSLVREQGAWALGKMKDKKAVEPLIQALEDQDWHIRQRAAWALGEIKDSVSIEHLIHALKDQDWHVRETTAHALGIIVDTRAVEPLIEALEDKYPTVRNKAANALGKIREARAVESLKKVLNDKDPDVRSTARESLNNIKTAELRKRAKPRRRQKPARYRCNSCGTLQADGAWEKAMDAQAKAMGMKGFINLSSPPQCLNCGSTDLDDLSMPEKKREKIRKQKESARSRHEYTELIELLMRWESSYSTRERTEKKIKSVGMRLAEEGGKDLMYDVCIAIDQRRWQDVVSSCWNGISGWMH